MYASKSGSYSESTDANIMYWNPGCFTLHIMIINVYSYLKLVSLNNPKWMSNIQIKDKIKSIYKVNDVCMAYKDLFTVYQYFFII